MKELGTGTLRGAEKSSQYTEEDGWAGTKPDSGRQSISCGPGTVLHTLPDYYISFSPEGMEKELLLSPLSG